MTPSDALATVQLAARLRRIDLSYHSRKRGAERGVQPNDLYSAIRTATSAEWSEEHGSWNLLGGVDTDGEPLTVAAFIEDAKVTIGTIFGD